MTTLPGLLLDRAAASPNAVALRFFRRGKWNEVTASGLRDKAAAIGSGLAACGVGTGDVVAVLCADGPVAVAAELGAQGIGAAVLALDPDLDAHEVNAAINASGARAVIAGDQEQFDKVHDQRAELASVKSLVVDATRGLRHLDVANRPDRDDTMTMAQLEKRGENGGWGDAVRRVDPSATARVSPTGVRHDHAALIASARTIGEALGLCAADSVYSLHPLADATERALVSHAVLVAGATVHFGQQGIAEAGVRQVAPSIIHATPTWLGGLDADMTSQVSRARLLKKASLDAGLKRQTPSSVVGSNRRRLEPTRIAGLLAAVLVFVFLVVSTELNDFLRILVCALLAAAVGLGLVFSGHAVAGPLRRRYGLSRARAVVSSEPLADGASSVLGALAVPLVSLKSEV